MCFSSAATSVLQREWKPSLPPQNTEDHRHNLVEALKQDLDSFLNYSLTEIFCTQLLGNFQPLLNLSGSIRHNMAVRVGGSTIHVPVTALRCMVSRCRFISEHNHRSSALYLYEFTGSFLLILSYIMDFWF